MLSLLAEDRAGCAVAVRPRSASCCGNDVTRRGSEGCKRMRPSFLLPVTPQHVTLISLASFIGTRSELTARLMSSVALDQAALRRPVSSCIFLGSTRIGGSTQLALIPDPATAHNPPSRRSPRRIRNLCRCNACILLLVAT